jgi:hypothetical protein
MQLNRPVCRHQIGSDADHDASSGVNRSLRFVPSENVMATRGPQAS